VNLQSIIDNLISDTLQTSVPLFIPELILCGTVVLMLLLRVFTSRGGAAPFLLSLVGAVAGFWYALPLGARALETGASHEIFTGMLVYDSVTVFIRALLFAFLVLFVLLSRLTGIAERDDSQDYFTLVLGATLGMCVMASANHLITVFLGVEMASVPSYVLAGILRGRSRSSEAALKYSVYGAGAAGVMLYGVSLLAGVLGTAHLPTMARQLAAMDIGGMIDAGEGTGTLMVLALGGLMVMVGLAFKLSAVPFHFWCPDIFHGAPAEIGAFLSVASKAAAIALLVRVAVGLGVLPTGGPPADTGESGQVAAATGVNAVGTASEDSPFRFAAAAETEELRTPNSELGNPDEPLAPVRTFIVRLIAVVAIITSTFGNLAAYGQTNIKRLLAYSTIAHAGYMMMPVAAAIALAGRNNTEAQLAIAALLFYAGAYLFMNLGAFAIVAVLRNAMGSEEIEDYGGLIRSCPVTTVALVAILFSLIGMPPLAGFVGKFYIFRSLVVAGGPLMYLVLFVAGINTVLSLVYYLRVAKVMCIDPEPDTRPPVSLGFVPGFFIVAVSLPVLLFGIYPAALSDLAEWAKHSLFV
jgi:NADH-quinone oxidoreductase subunit N